jgi:hypothetical protein
MSNYFFLIFAITIVITRVVVFLYPISSPAIGKFRVHHYMYGLVVSPIGLATHSIIVYAIGLGLFADELAYLLIGGKTHQDNYSKLSLLGTLILMILVFILRDYIILPFSN